MAGRTVGKIRLRRDAEVVQYVSFTNPLLVIGIKKLPGPVFGFMDLFRRFGMAFDAGLRYFGTGFKTGLQFLELGVVSS